MKLVIILASLLTVASCCKKEENVPTECEIKCSITQEDGNGGLNGARYFFDPKEKKCKLGRWTGSDKLKPFETLEECEACGCE